MDFSVNVNPYEPPYDLTSLSPFFTDWLKEYPDPKSISLKKSISSFDQVRFEHLFIGNGAAHCIFLLAQLFKEQTIGVIQPTFVEYKEAAKLYGCTIKEITVTKENDWLVTNEELLPFLEEIDVLFLCNPNNPTGTVLGKERMEEVIQLTKATNTYLIVDEAFYDFSSVPCSIAHEVEKHAHVIVLRSLTKMYKLAGIRIGYVIGPTSIVERLNANSPPWSVNRIAAELAEHVLSKRDYPDEIRRRTQVERERVLLELEKLGFYVSPSKVNFYLLSDMINQDNLDGLINHLLLNGVVPRHTYNFPGLDGKYIRLAVREQKSNNVLLSHLKGWREHC
ncbi:aminotransferase class I/II-fold pyridoxal phosphate-dependent enzyme [Bacillus sp. AK128]